MNLLRRSIRTQLIVVTIVSLIVLAGTIEFVALNQQQAVYITSERRVGLTLIRSISNTINSVKSFINTLSDIAELDTRLAELVQLNTNIDFIAVVDADGLMIFHSDHNLQGSVIPELAQPPVDTTVSKTVPGRGEVFLTSLSFDGAGLTDTPNYWIIVASAAQPIREQLWNAAVSSAIIPTLFTILVAFFFIVFLQSYLVFPIRQLTKAANAIESGNLNVQVTTKQNNEIGQLTRSFNSMTHQLSDLVTTLEDRVRARTRDLQLAADVSHRIASKLEDKALFKELVEETCKAFNLSQVALFLYNPEKQQLEYQQGASLDESLAVNRQSIVRIGEPGALPQVMATRKTVLVNNAHDPSTNNSVLSVRAELALPMMIQDELIGVLDLQSKDADRFNENQILVFTTLAGQFAVAVRNAQLLTQTQQSLEVARKANAVKSTFLASMSHELRTPLNAIINFNKFVLKGIMGPINDSQTEALKAVDEGAEHLLNLINDVLDISKIESGSLVLLIEDNVNINTLLDNAIKTSRALLGEKNVNLVTDIVPDMPLLRGDKQRILQIILNILSNACKFTDTGEIRVKAIYQNNEVRISIQDTGPGIAPAEEHLVFEAFKQAQSGINQGQGTGLGMPISKRLAEAHGGNLYFETKSGQGTTFYVTLPINSEKLVTPLP